MDLIKEWRLHKPTLELKKHSGEHFFSIPCEVISVSDSPILGDSKFIGSHLVEIKYLNFDSGEFEFTQGFMYKPTYRRMNQLNLKLPDLTYCDVMIRDNSIVFIVYKLGTYFQGKFDLIKPKYLLENELEFHHLTEDCLLEFQYNYKEIKQWINDM